MQKWPVFHLISNHSLNINALCVFAMNYWWVREEYCITVTGTLVVVYGCSCGDRYKVSSFLFLRYWWPTSLAAFTALRYQIPRLLMCSRNLYAGTSSVTRRNSFEGFKKDSSHNQASPSIEATTHSHDSEIRKLNFLATNNPPQG